jgi:two-component system nitrate/nitrite response regulator NarL
MKPRLLLVDPHALVLEALAVLLADFDVVGFAADGLTAVAEAQNLVPDVLSLELDLPTLGGLEVIGRLRALQPKVRCLVVTQHVDRPRALIALAAGARGYALKTDSPAELLQAVATVAAGGLYISRQLNIQTDELRSRSMVYTPQQMTGRQCEVLSRIAMGKAVKVIASDLGISHKTVEFHKACISRFLGVRTTAGLARYAIAHGLAPVTAKPAN